MNKTDDPELPEPEQPVRSASNEPSNPPEPPEPPVPSTPRMPEMPKMQRMREEAQQQMKETQQRMREAQQQMRESQQQIREMQQQMREIPDPLKGQRERRAQRQKLVADVIARNTIRSQSELQELLQEQGVLATQSSVSRDLRDLGVRRVKGVYVIKPSREGGWSFDDVIELVELVTRSGFNLTVIQTVPNAARLVAHTLEETGWDEVVGTVADDDTVFVATRTEEDQDRLFQRFKQYLNV